MTTQITECSIYCYKGKDYQSLQQIQDVVIGELGAIIDTIPNTSPKDRLKVLAMFGQHHDELARLLTVGYDASDDPLYANEKNILDL